MSNGVMHQGIAQLPRQLSLWAVIAFTAVGTAGWVRFEAKIAGIEEKMLESRARGDAMRAQIQILDREGDASRQIMTRLQEQISSVQVLMREIRDDLRQRPR